jgi:chromosome segregation ATPase
MLADKKAEILALTNTLASRDTEIAQLSHNLEQAKAEIDRLRAELAKTIEAYEDALAKLRQEMARALLHAEEEAFALRKQLEKRFDASNAQLAAALAEVAGLKQELAALKLEYSKYKMRAEAREAEQQAHMDQLLQRVAALERDKTALQTEVNEAKEALHKAGMLERQLRMEVSNVESLVQQKTKTISWYEAEMEEMTTQNMAYKSELLALSAKVDKDASIIAGLRQATILRSQYIVTSSSHMLGR